MLRSRSRKFWKPESVVGVENFGKVGHFTSGSATLVTGFSQSEEDYQ